MLRALLVPAMLAVGVGGMAISSVSRLHDRVTAKAQRRWVTFKPIPDELRGAEPLGEARRVRIVSYNVLGPRHGITSKHGHCPLTLRRWAKRSAMLRDEIAGYHDAADGGVHAICLQEVTPKTLRDTWVPFMRELGLGGFVYQPKHRFPKRLRSHECLGVAVFYSTEHFEKTAERRVFFPEQLHRLRARSESSTMERKRKRYDGSSSRGVDVLIARDDSGSEDGDFGEECGVDTTNASRLEQDLEDKPDAAVLVRLRLKRKRDGCDYGAKISNRTPEQQPSFTLACCHLWFDPFRPDLKTAQCRLLFDAIARFHTKCGVTVHCREAGVTGGGELLDSPFEQETAPANLIICGDFNSVPLVNPAFLPGPLKVAAKNILTVQDIPEAPSSSSTIYPSSEEAASGVYSLISYGYVAATHPEHPDTFIPELLKVKETADDGAVLWKDRYPARNPRDIPPLHHPFGGWSSSFGRALEDVYRDRGVLAPRFTTKTSQFSGVIDHIFVSSREKCNGLEITGALAFPTGADVGTLAGTGNGQARGGDQVTAIDGDGVEGGNGSVMASKNETTREEFGPIPDEVWGSDHLALGVEVAFV